jgi:hypothetical protein
VTTKTSGKKVAELCYKPFGEKCFKSGATPTEYKFRANQTTRWSLSNVFLNARWYDAAIGRFSLADTLVPNLYNSRRAKAGTI